MTFGSRPERSNNQPALPDAAGMQPAAATGTSETLIPLPAPGAIVVVDLSSLASAQFAFDPGAARATVRGDDLVLSVNGGEIVLVGYVEALRLGTLPTIVSPD